MRFDSESVCVLEHGDMAKKRASVKEKPRQAILMVYKADDERAAAYKAWLEGLAKHTGAPLTVMVDQALLNWAKVHKYAPPPRRLR